MNKVRADIFRGGAVGTEGVCTQNKVDIDISFVLIFRSIPVVIPNYFLFSSIQGKPFPTPQHAFDYNINFKLHSYSTLRYAR